jgi:hypothetical protein
MKTVPFCRAFARGVAPWVISLLCLMSLARASTPTKEDFGFGHAPLAPTRPLLVIVVNIGTTPDPSDAAWWTNVFFGPSATNVAGYFHEMSNGRFTWLPVGVTEVSFPTRPAATDTAILSSAFDSNHLDLHLFDTNNPNGTVDQTELGVVVLMPDGGQTRGGVVGYSTNSTNCHWEGICAFASRYDLAAICHEMCHSLGDLGRNVTDLYGRWCCDSTTPPFIHDNWNNRLTIMNNNGIAEWCNLDPWNKMQLGWSEPRIASMRAGGLTNLPAAQLMDVDAPLLLYDPERGAQEFWLLEYRTPTVSSGSRYDASVSGQGLVIWHVKHETNALLDNFRTWMFVMDGVLPTNSETNWWYCGRCHALYYTHSGGYCVGTGVGHSARYTSGGLLDYRIAVNNALAWGESGWRRCFACQEMFYGPNQANSFCGKTSQPHQAVDGDDYTIPTDTLAPFYPFHGPAWQRCTNCQSLFSTEDTASPPPPATYNRCPARNSLPHQGAGLNYDLVLHGNWLTVAAEGAPDLFYASSVVWTAGTNTPPLRYYDFTQSRTRVYVHPFPANADSITVEWGLDDVWVDFYFYGIERGTFSQPYNTVAEGVADVFPGSTLHIKQGHSPETRRITKPMRIQGYNGKATIGH